MPSLNFDYLLYLVYDFFVTLGQMVRDPNLIANIQLRLNWWWWAFFFISIVLFVLTILSIILGRRMAEGKWRFSFKMIYYMFILGFLSPTWFFKAIYNTILSRKPAWR